MAKYKVVMKFSNGSTDEQDETFDTEEAAEAYGLYLCGCYYEGAEILNLSNPGDYPIDEDDEVDFKVIEAR